jgi:microcystin-dependent protein
MATLRANEDTRSLFAELWNNVSNTYCPVSGGRGGSATLDFDAGKQLTIPKLLGRSPIGVGKSDVSGGPTWTPGYTDGENTHLLSVGEIASHTHGNYINDPMHRHTGVITGSVPATTGGGAFTVVATLTGGATNYEYTGLTITNVAAGGGGAHNTLHPATAMYYHIKL